MIVPNGFYDIKVFIKLIPTAENKSKFKVNKNTIALKINDELHEPAPMALDDEIVLDNPNLGVTNREIRIRWAKGTINISEVEIIPQNPPLAKGGPRLEVGRNTWGGASCFESPLNCVFSDGDMKDVKNCSGKFVKIGGKASNKDIACMNKCINAEYEFEDKCLLYCPETLECVKKKQIFVCERILPKKDEPQAPAV